jgi:hypothetical protein
MCLAGLTASIARAQLDPEPRQLLHLGVTQPLREDGPQAHYLFYYWNMPDVPKTNEVLRLILAPTYLDSELGIKGSLCPPVFNPSYQPRDRHQQCKNMHQPGLLGAE